jgi:hypothetical protein
MESRSSSWLLLALVGLAALVAAELRFELGTGDGGKFVGRGDVPSMPSSMPPFTLADRETFSETLERPLFMPNRQVPEVAAAEPAAPVRETPTPQANRYALSAIIIVDDERVALLTDTATGGASRVKEGESISGWQVEEIRAQSAVLTKGDTREELPLRTFGPPLPAPNTRGPAASAQPNAPNRRADNASGSPAVKRSRPKRFTQQRR